MLIIRLTESHPLSLITLQFLLWKTILLLLSFLSPGPGYDTSASLQQQGVEFNLLGVRNGSESGQRLLQHLVRWDAIYYQSIARRGYLYEQEWAFGWGFTQLVHYTCKVFCRGASGITPFAWTGIVISNVSHLLSTIVLHRLLLSATGAAANRRQAQIAATLHIFAPAGLFLSSPFSESGFSLLNFLGYWLYVRGSKRRSLGADTSLVLSGLLFGAATTFRSNGILNGVLFAADLLSLGPSGVWSNLRYAVALVLGGVLNGLGSALPQYIAYRQYCGTGSPAPRPWCSSTLPSVYTFVQRHYWNVGFLRYWTVSNLPLFALAMPMLTLMLCSALWPLRSVADRRMRDEKAKDASAAETASFATKMWTRLALPQLLLTGLAATSFHVQTITRIASGYVLPYIMLANVIVDGERLSWPLNNVKPKWIVRWMIMYALIQGALYASFLPPA